MKHLADLMNSADFTTGELRDDLIIGRQREKHKGIADLQEKILYAYSWLGKEFKLIISSGKNAETWWFSPSKGIYSYIGKIIGKAYKAIPPKVYDEDKDIILVIRFI